MIAVTAHQYALFYAAAGLSVFPVYGLSGGRCTCKRSSLPEDHRDFCGITSHGEIKGSPAKHPMTRNGLKDATTDIERINAWWTAAPEAGIGMPAGDNGFAVVDIDPKNGGEESFTRLHAFVLKHAGVDLLDTQVARTGSGGMHLVFAAPDGGVKNDSKVFGADMPGIDTRGRGGYIVVEPSLHISGGRYEWLGEERDPAPWPGLLSALMDPPKPLTAPPTIGPRQSNPSRYAEAALDNELNRVRGAFEGERNNTLNRAAFSLGQLVGAGLLSEISVTNELVGAATAVGLGTAEALKTVSSGLRNGRNFPRQLAGAA